jgi:hypothetical protein
MVTALLPWLVGFGVGNPFQMGPAAVTFLSRVKPVLERPANAHAMGRRGSFFGR